MQREMELQQNKRDHLVAQRDERQQQIDDLKAESAAQRDNIKRLEIKKKLIVDSVPALFAEEQQKTMKVR